MGELFDESSTKIGNLRFPRQFRQRIAVAVLSAAWLLALSKVMSLTVTCPI